MHIRLVFVHGCQITVYGCRLKVNESWRDEERLSAALAVLTPEQVCGVDRGQIQIGTLLNIEALTSDDIVNGNGFANGGVSNGHNDDDTTDSHYERFGNSTVQVRIEKQALENQASRISLSDTMRDFARQIETLLKASS